MQKTAIKAKSSKSYSRPSLQKSVTLSRRYVQRPRVKEVSSVKRPDVNKKVEVAAMQRPVKVDRAEKARVTSDVHRTAFKTRAKASELSRAISASAEKTGIRAVKYKRPSMVQKATTGKADKRTEDAARATMRGLATVETVKPMRKHHGRRIAIAVSCAAIVAVSIGAFVVLNMPNISVKIAAAQTGIDATYPDFVPRNYSMETVASDKSGVVTMKFVGPEGASFTLTEEKSTWDSKAVLNNYVSTTYSANYSTMHEQGITYYTEPGSAVWVNGGVLYKITSQGKNLSKEQIRNLVVSL